MSIDRQSYRAGYRQALTDQQTATETLRRAVASPDDHWRSERARALEVLRQITQIIGSPSWSAGEDLAIILMRCLLQPTFDQLAVVELNGLGRIPTSY